MELLEENDTNTAVQIFFETTSRDILRLKLDHNCQNNLSKDERWALENLRNNDSFEIIEADKGGNISLWPKDMYCMEARRQLSNTQYYQILPSDRTLTFKTQLERLLSRAWIQGIINKKDLDFLSTSYPVVPTFYMLPKVHKSITRPPGRPIVSGIGGLYERPCIYLDYFLQPIVLGLDSYTRDSSHLIRQLEGLDVPTNTLLVTLNMEALYTNIQHDLDDLVF
ncbi:unnamed protein product [Ranitomeya imitator]|uniref:Uncharacterized protein n=1 Tax=Ranitomeya imitator TaxID=111125 RepID=A0ABN9M7R4_9NEOB|nr:unnamed protein product [Ranitomeya imitator]